jgi:choline dehydrogenase
LTDAPVTRVVLREGRAAGVVYRRGDQQIEAQARREIVLAAGSVDSPKILELSGIGNASLLQRVGIPVLRHLPGVGENLIDHLQVRVTFQCTKPITFNDIYASRLRTAKLGLKYLLRHRGLMATPLTTAHALTRTRSDLARPDVRFQLHHFSSADRAGYGKRGGLDAYSGFLFGIFKLRPESRGWIHISDRDARNPPKIQPNQLSHPADVQTYIDAIKLSRRISSAAPLKPYIVRETRPSDAVHSDAAITKFVRETGVTSYHPIGTCRMGNDAMAVVDSRLRVHGVPGLRVVDASIMPTMVSSNTNAPTILIGERGAEFILADAGHNVQALNAPDRPVGMRTTHDPAEIR